MKKALLASVTLAVVLVFGGLNIYAQDVVMPDYSSWTSLLDHREPYTLGGKRVDMRDQHFEFINQTRTERQVLVVFYNPTTNEPWFSIYAHQYSDLSKSEGVYMFEQIDGKWLFIQDLSGIADIADILLKNYGLVPVGQ